MPETFAPETALEKFGGMVYHLALVQTQNEADAEDVFQEVFLRLVKKGGAFESEDHLRAWILRVTLNCSRDLWRSSYRKNTVPLPEAFAEEPAAESPEESGVYEAVLALPPKYRAVIHLFYYEDLPLTEISRILRITYHAASQRLSRARRALKLSLQEETDHEIVSQRIP